MVAAPDWPTCQEWFRSAPDGWKLLPLLPGIACMGPRTLMRTDCLSRFLCPCLPFSIPRQAQRYARSLPSRQSALEETVAHIEVTPLLPRHRHCISDPSRPLRPTSSSMMRERRSRREGRKRGKGHVKQGVERGNILWPANVPFLGGVRGLVPPPHSPARRLDAAAVRPAADVTATMRACLSQAMAARYGAPGIHEALQTLLAGCGPRLPTWPSGTPAPTSTMADVGRARMPPPPPLPARQRRIPWRCNGL